MNMENQDLDVLGRTPSGRLWQPDVPCCAVVFGGGRHAHVLPVRALLPLVRLPAPEVLAGGCVLLPDVPAGAARLLLSVLSGSETDDDLVIASREDRAAAAHLCRQLGGDDLSGKLLPCDAKQPKQERTEDTGLCFQRETGATAVDTALCVVRRGRQTGLPASAATLLQVMVGVSVTLVPADGGRVSAHRLALCLYCPRIRRVYETLAQLEVATRRVDAESSDQNASHVADGGERRLPSSLSEAEATAAGGGSATGLLSSRLHSPDVLVVPALSAADAQAIVDYIYKGETTAASPEQFRRRMEDWIDFDQLPLVEGSVDDVDGNGAEEGNVTTDEGKHKLSLSVRRVVPPRRQKCPRKPKVRTSAAAAAAASSGAEELTKLTSPEPELMPLKTEQNAVEYAVDDTGVPGDFKVEWNDPDDPDSLGDTEEIIPEVKPKQTSCTRSGVRSRVVKCRVCGKKVSVAGLKDHLRIHTGERPYSCDFCDKTFSSMSGRRNHMKQHNDAKDSVCDICGKKFTRHNLWTHMKTHTRPYECETCGAKFSSQLHLQNHVVSKHDRALSKNRCDICGRLFSQKTHLRAHVRLHSDNGKPFCVDCRRAFPSEQHLANHRMLKHSSVAGKVQCKECGKVFSKLSSLAYHERSHTGVKPHQCTFCDKKFARPDGLQIHLRRHTGDKPYYCPDCPKQTVSKAALNKHMQVHTAETRQVLLATEEDAAAVKDDVVSDSDPLQDVQESVSGTASVQLPKVEVTQAGLVQLGAASAPPSDQLSQPGQAAPAPTETSVELVYPTVRAAEVAAGANTEFVLAEEVHIQTPTGVVSVELPSCLLGTSANGNGNSVELHPTQYITYI